MRILTESVYTDMVQHLVSNNTDSIEAEVYVNDFKEFLKRNLIKDEKDKNLQLWLKRPFDDFIDFIVDLRTLKSKTQLKKEIKEEGSKLVHEDDNWLIYQINTHEASKTYGKGTKWCITTKDSRYFDNYSESSTFYFMLSKHLKINNKWYKIAVQTSHHGTTYWDAKDNSHSSLPSSLNVPQFDFKVLLPDFLIKDGELKRYRGTDASSVMIPSSVNVIKTGAFSGVNMIEKVKIPSSVTIIESKAFENCSSLKVIEGCENVKTIGPLAFASCTSLKHFTFWDNLEQIGEGLLKMCTSLEEVEFKSTLLNHLPNELFNRCKSLKHIKIPETIKTMGVGLFWGCSSLKEVIIPDSVTEMGSCMFQNCSNLEGAKLPESLNAIPSGTFWNCSSLINYAIPTNINIISATSFMGCSNLTDIVINDNVDVIGSGAFAMCDNLSSCKIYGSPKIGNNAFADCPKLIIHCTDLELIEGDINKWNPDNREIKIIKEGINRMDKKLTLKEYIDSPYNKRDDLFSSRFNVGTQSSEGTIRNIMYIVKDSRNRFIRSFVNPEKAVNFAKLHNYSYVYKRNTASMSEKEFWSSNKYDASREVAATIQENWLMETDKEFGWGVISFAGGKEPSKFRFWKDQSEAHKHYEEQKGLLKDNKLKAVIMLDSEGEPYTTCGDVDLIQYWIDEKLEAFIKDVCENYDETPAGSFGSDQGYHGLAPGGGFSSPIGEGFKLRKPKFWDTQFAANVIKDYKNGKLKNNKNAIKEWDKNENGGKDPIPAFNTADIINYYEQTKSKDLKEDLDYDSQEVWVITNRGDYVEGVREYYEKLTKHVLQFPDREEAIEAASWFTSGFDDYKVKVRKLSKREIALIGGQNYKPWGPSSFPIDESLKNNKTVNFQYLAYLHKNYISKNDLEGLRIELDQPFKNMAEVKTYIDREIISQIFKNSESKDNK